jgi:hypothetical protein
LQVLETLVATRGPNFPISRLVVKIKRSVPDW